MRVLVLDDDGRFRHGLVNSLKKMGMEVEAAACAHTALQQLRQERFDAVVCDVVLPGLSGLGLIQSLRREGIMVACHVVSVSDTEYTRAAAHEVGAQSFFAKPVNFHQLGLALQSQSFPPTKPNLPERV